MALKFAVDSLDDVPAEFHSLYAEKDGKFTLQVDGAVPKARLDEFRTNNTTLRQQIEELNARFDGVDPETYRALAEKQRKLDDKKLIDAGKVDELVQQRVDAMKAEHDKALGLLTKERDTFKGQLEAQLIDGGLRDAAIKSGVRPEAVDDVLLRGRQTFRIAEGRAVAYDGDKPLYGKDGEPLSVSDWVGGLAEKAPHLFAPSSGGGTPAGGSRQTGSKVMTRGAFDALAPAAKAAAAKEMGAGSLTIKD